MTIRRLRFIAFLGFLLLVASSVGVTIWALRTQQDDALVISLAGRQRMLIQQMTLETLGVQIGTDPIYRQSLQQTTNEFEQMLNALTYGGVAPYDENTTVILPATPAYETQILAQLEKVRSTWNEMRPAIHDVLQNDPQSTTFVEAVSTIEQLSPVLLEQMDDATLLYEGEATRKIVFAQNVQLIFLALAVIQLIVSFFITERWILKPIGQLVNATQLIGVGDFETQVSIKGLGELDWLTHNLEEMRQKLLSTKEVQTTLLDLSHRLLSTQEEHPVMECAVEASTSILHADFSALVLPDIEGRLYIKAARGWPTDYVGRIELGLGDASQTGYTITHGTPVQVEDYSTEKLFNTPKIVFENKIVSGLSVPMFSNGRIVGAMLVHSRTRRLFNEEEIQLLSLIANQTAVALEKAHLFAAEAQRAKEAETLRQAGAVLATTIRQDEAIELILQQLERVVPYNSASVQLWMEDETHAGTGYLKIVGGRGWPDAAMVVDTRFPVPGDNPNTLVIEQRRPYTLEDAPTKYAAFREKPHSHIHSWLGVPMVVHDQVIGMLAVDNSASNYFTSEHIRLVSAFADQVAVALEKARLFDAEQKRVEELSILYEIAALGLEVTSVDTLIRRALQIIGNTIHPDYFGIGLIDGTAGVLRIRRATRTISEEFLTLPLGQGVAGQVVSTGKPRRIPDVSREPSYKSVNPGTRSELCVPLRVGEHIIGMINIESASLSVFGEADERFMTTFAGQLAIAIEKVRLFQSEQRGREVVSSLLEIMQLAGSSLELKEVLKHIAQRTAQICQANRCTIFLLDERGKILQPVMSQFADEHPDAEQWRAFKATTADRVDVVPLFRDAIHEQRPALLEDAARTDLVPIKWTQPFGIKKMLVVPLVSHDKTIGLMALDLIETNKEFAPAQVEQALTIAGQVTSAIKNAQLYAEVELRAEQLRALHDASHAMASDLRLEIVLQKFVETARLMINAKYAALAVINDDKKLTHFYTAGITEKERKQIGEPPQGRGLLGVGLQEGVPIRVTDLAQDPRSVGFPAHHPPMKTLVSMPIVVHGKVIGSLYLADKAGGRPFTQQDEDLLARLAIDAATAIENAKLFSEVEEFATTDSLTGLYNRRHFMELAKREFGRARRYQRPLTAIMMDIDRFKQVNDTYGHAVGDQVLRAVAERCRKIVRDIDILGRYGGEEFAALLFETDLDGGRIVAERLRQCVAAPRINTDGGALIVTVSVGVAILDKECTGLDTLLVYADQALYVAKQEGRNRVSIWQK